jgi:hypothetical protein
MSERYIGFNDNVGNDCGLFSYTDTYEDGIEDVLMREIRMSRCERETN